MPESVKSGNIYGSLEASYPTESKYADTTNVALYLVHEFMQDEGKFLQLKADVEREEEARLLDPDAAGALSPASCQLRASLVCPAAKWFEHSAGATIL